MNKRLVRISETAGSRDAHLASDINGCYSGRPCGVRLMRSKRFGLTIEMEMGQHHLTISLIPLSSSQATARYFYFSATTCGGNQRSTFYFQTFLLLVSFIPHWRFQPHTRMRRAERC